MAMARLTTSSASLKNFTCGIINVKSGACPEDCVFCAQSAHYATNIPAYPFLPADEILAKAEAKLNRESLDYLGLVASGAELTERDFDQLCRSARLIQSRFDIRLCASIGLLNSERARALKQAGFTSCHHNLETSSGYFHKICTTHSYEQRLDTVKAAQAAGLRMCCGGLFGLGESFEDRCELAAELNELGVDSIPVNFLFPIKGTPLEKQEIMPPAEALRTISLFRLYNPDKDMVICGGRLEALQSFKNMIFSAGANGLMLGDYLTRQGGRPNEDVWEMSVLGAR
jgi:biotin synthase